METFKQKIKEDLHRYLLGQGCVEQVLPDTPDIEEKWKEIAEAYLPDGMREFAAYPTVSLGWMMYVGMAVAAMWDKDWPHYAALDNLYLYLRDQRGYDTMDEYILEEVLSLDESGRKQTERFVAECASRTNSQLLHAPFQPGTKEAFEAYVTCLQQLYMMGAAASLKQLGYRMTRIE